MKQPSFLAVLAAVVLAGSLARAADLPFDLAPVDEKPPLAFAVLTDREVVRPGSSFRVAVVLTIEPGWYSYANPKGPGFGESTVVAGEPKEGFTFGSARYLPGKRKSQDEIQPGSWVSTWTGETPVFLEVTAAPSLAPGAYELAVNVAAQACSDSCIMFKERLPFTVKVEAGEGEPKKANEAVFARFGEAALGEEGAAAPVEPAKTGDEPPVDLSRFEPRTLEGQGGEISGLLMAILFGFLAGIILNVMPCVLPVVSIKILSLVQQAHEDRARVFRLGLSFGAGVMVVFLALALLAAGIGRAAQGQWGEHFTSEEFLVVMVSVIFVFALGLFDVYLILVPGGAEAAGTREGYLGSFFKGVLATFLATPCSGPFLGATLAWALTQPPAIVITIFTSIGLGMAAPYVILSASPGLLKFVPRPGAWMETFKHLMGFVLLGTVVYLFSLLRKDLVVWTLAFCLALGLGAYLWGRFAHGAVPLARRWAWRAALLAGVALAAWACFRPAGETTEWQPFTLATLEEERAKGRNVLVDFTADWCPNCKFVEKFVLETESIQNALGQKGVVLLKADITRSPARSPEVRMLNRLGSRSIPFLAIFPADDHYRPYILRDVYGKDAVLEIIERLPGA